MSNRISGNGDSLCAASNDSIARAYCLASYAFSPSRNSASASPAAGAARLPPRRAGEQRDDERGDQGALPGRRLRTRRRAKGSTSSASLAAPLAAGRAGRKNEPHAPDRLRAASRGASATARAVRAGWTLRHERGGGEAASVRRATDRLRTAGGGRGRRRCRRDRRRGAGAPTAVAPGRTAGSRELSAGPWARRHRPPGRAQRTSCRAARGPPRDRGQRHHRHRGQRGCLTAPQTTGFAASPSPRSASASAPPLANRAFGSTSIARPRNRSHAAGSAPPSASFGLDAPGIGRWLVNISCAMRPERIDVAGRAWRGRPRCAPGPRRRPCPRSRCRARRRRVRPGMSKPARPKSMITRAEPAALRLRPA